MALKQSQKDALFESLLSYAVKECAIIETQKIPGEEELKTKVNLSIDFQEKMRKIIKKNRYKKFIKEMYRWGKKVLLIISVIISIGFGSLMSVEAVQNVVISTVSQWYKDHTGFIFENTSNKSYEEIKMESIPKKPSYIPKDFKLVMEENMGTLRTYVYENNDGMNIVFFSEIIGNKSQTFIDNEYTNYEIIHINGNEVYLFASKNDDFLSLVWIDHNILYKISSDKNLLEIIKVLKSVK